MSDALPKGTRVEIIDLASRPELNGQCATVKTYDKAKKRYGCKLDSGDSMSLKAEKLRVIDDAAGELLASSSTLLDFRPARRSFGKFNPRLEKGLAEIESQKSALRERLAAEASAEATRAQREAAGQAASAARAEVQQAQTAADQEMAEHFSKYLPAPPEAAKPVKLREDPPPRSSGGGISMGGGKKRKARR